MTVRALKLYPAFFLIIILFFSNGCTFKKDAKIPSQIDREVKKPDTQKPTQKAPKVEPKQEEPVKVEPAESISPKNINPATGVTDNKHLAWWIRRVPKSVPGIDGNFLKLMARYNGLYVGNTTQKQISLTFDVGDAGNESVPALLAMLKKHNVRANFFIAGKWVEKNPQVFKNILAEGHLIGNHSYSHPDFTTLSTDQMANEIEKTNQLFEKFGGKKPIFFRPPFGYFSETVLNKVYSMGYYTTFWGISMADWKPMTQEQLVHGVTDYAHNGAIAILHVTSDGVKALDTTIPQLKAQGYELVTLDKLIK